MASCLCFLYVSIQKIGHLKEVSYMNRLKKKRLQGDYLQFLMDLLLVKKYSILLSCTQSMGIQALHHHPFCITKTY